MGDKKGSVNVDGVKISWNDGRYISSAGDPTGDLDMRGKYRVTISAENADIEKISHAIACANRLKMLSDAGDLVCPVPGSEHTLRLAGITDMGCPVWRVVVGSKECDAIPANELSHMDPTRYSNAGERAMKTITWMRAVGRITNNFTSKDDTLPILFSWNADTIAAAMLQFCGPEAEAITV